MVKELHNMWSWWTTVEGQWSGGQHSSQAPKTTVELRNKHRSTAKGALLHMWSGADWLGTCWVRKIGDWTDSTKPAIIICQGGTGCAMLYKEWAQKMAKAYGGRVLLWDRFNMGLSDRLPTNKHKNDFDLYSEQLSLIMSQLDLPSAHFVGFSFGGVVVAHFASLHPDKCCRIAMCAPVIGGVRGPLTEGPLAKVRTCPCMCAQVAAVEKLMLPKLVARSEGQVKEGGDPDGLGIAKDMYHIKDAPFASTAWGMAQGFLHTFWSSQKDGALDLCQQLRDHKIPVYVRTYTGDADQNYEGLRKAINILQPEACDEREGKHHQFYEDDTLVVVAGFLSRAAAAQSRPNAVVATPPTAQL
jgi:pimeloyl-ACP methyl ester carboxylesterase